jgi:hypothetical protein
MSKRSPGRSHVATRRHRSPGFPATWGGYSTYGLLLTTRDDVTTWCPPTCRREPLGRVATGARLKSKPRPGTCQNLLAITGAYGRFEALETVVRKCAKARTPGLPVGPVDVGQTHVETRNYSIKHWLGKPAHTPESCP